jgi:hypothetical protein
MSAFDKRRAPFWILLALLLSQGLVTAQASMIARDDGTILDTRTGLMWDRCSLGLSGNDCSQGTAIETAWGGALKAIVAANGDNHKGYSDWRMPNRQELESIVDPRRHNPAANPDFFPNLETGRHRFYFTSTLNIPLGDTVRSIHFGLGEVLHVEVNGSAHVLMVRDDSSNDLLEMPGRSYPTWVLGAGIGLLLIIGILFLRRERD